MKIPSFILILIFIKPYLFSDLLVEKVELILEDLSAEALEKHSSQSLSEGWEFNTAPILGTNKNEAIYTQATKTFKPFLTGSIEFEFMLIEHEKSSKFDFKINHFENSTTPLIRLSVGQNSMILRSGVKDKEAGTMRKASILYKHAGIEKNKWHHLNLEFYEQDFLVTLNHQIRFYGKSQNQVNYLNIQKNQLGFDLKGYEKFRNLKVYQGKVAENWASIKPKYISTMKKN